jgi:hypothetical protein
LELHNLKNNIEKTVASLFILMLAGRINLNFFFELSMQNVWKCFKIKYIHFCVKSETQTVCVVPNFLILLHMDWNWLG